MSRPRAVSGNAGSRIRVILGETGSDYLLCLDEDDGDCEWQRCDWTVQCGGPPAGLCQQMNTISAKGRHVTSVDFDALGQWHVSGKKRDGSGAHQWWGGTQGSDAIKKASNGQVYFGDNNVYGLPIWIVLEGRNGYTTHGIDESTLLSRIMRIHNRNKKINFIRCFNVHGLGPGYFISDGEGTEWNGIGTDASKELESGDGGRIYDVAVARDGSWVVIRENSFVLSTGVASKLQERLNQFYRDHRQRQKSRSQEVKAFDLRVERERESSRRQEMARFEAEKKSAKKRSDAARKAKVQAQREALKRKCDDADNFRQIQAKRLKPMKRVTAIGFSSEPGDAVVKEVRNCGSVEVVKPLHPEEHSFLIKDPRLLMSFHAEEDTTGITLLCCASDKFEAAVSMYHCACHDGICRCTHVATASFLPGTVLSSAAQRLLAHTPPRPVIENGEGSSPMIFDEYKCSEKIDLRRLREIAADLESDSSVREKLLDVLRRKALNGLHPDACDGLKALERCHALEEIVKALTSRLDCQPMDRNGCVTFQVDYEHRDPSGRGRLFAVGENIKITDSKYPRTATLQGMQSDLRVALVGKFAHDIDCANSEVRLVCSLAQQLGLQDLIPTVFDYRDNRGDWLRYIEGVHSVSESEAKRLVNIILSGGRYETWVKNVGKSITPPVPKKMKHFYFQLYSEIGALRDQLLQHPKFKWTEVEREKLKREGRPPRLIDSALMPRIVQCCENEVLGIIHRTFTQSNWVVRAKVFDGLIVEPGLSACRVLVDVNKDAEAACRGFGWDIQLVEKPLHGEANLPVSIDQARSCLSRLRGLTSPR